MTRVRVNHRSRTEIIDVDNGTRERNRPAVYFCPSFPPLIGTDRAGFYKFGINEQRPTLIAEKRVCSRTIDDRIIYANNRRPSAIVNAKRG